MIPQNKDTNDFRGSYEKQNNGGYTEIGEKERQEANYRGKEMHMMAVENLALCVLLMVI